MLCSDSNTRRDQNEPGINQQSTAYYYAEGQEPRDYIGSFKSAGAN